MAHVHYKFSSKLSYDTLVFDGPHITLADLKSRIMGREKLRAADCDLQITNAQNKEEYTDSECLISKGSSVVVKRVPIVGARVGSKNRNLERPDLRTHNNYGSVKSMGDHSFSVAVPFFSKIINLAHADVSEEDKLKTLSNQSLYDPLTYSSFTAVPHAKYTCYRCGNGGHHIKNCPTIGNDKNMEPPVKIRKSSGIPRSFMVEVDDPSIKGAMLTSSGRYAIPTIDAAAYAIGKKERPPFLQPEPQKVEDKKEPVPEELVCLICGDLLSDAVVIPCCGNSYCDDCIRSTLLDSEDHICPTCGQSSVSPDTLIANKFLRQAVNNYMKEKGDTSQTHLRSSQGLSAAPTPSPAPPQAPFHPQRLPQKLQHTQEVESRQPSLVVAPLPAASSTASTPDTSHQPAPVHRESPGTDAEGNSVTKSPVLNEESAAASSQTMISDLPPENPESVSVNPQGSFTASAQLTNWHRPMSSSSSSSGYSTSGHADASTQRHFTSSSFHPTPPALFPTPPFQPFLLPQQQQSLRVYPPGYPPPSPMWNPPNPQCPPVSSTSSIPPLIPKDWYGKHQRENSKRSPDRGSTYRSSYSHSTSTYSKSKSYSQSSSRSRSRSRSQERSRFKDEPTRSSSSYSYGYKRSPTPSSSSSSHESHHRKSRQSSRHYDKRSSRHSSRRTEEQSSRDSYVGQTSSQDQESQQYFEWKRQYEEWCDKYFNSYVNHFQQLPPPHLSHPPPHLQVNGDLRYSDSSKRSQSRRTRKSSSESRSPPSRSSESCSPFSKSSRDSRSPPSNLSSDSSSPPKDGQTSSHLLKKDQTNYKKQESKRRRKEQDVGKSDSVDSLDVGKAGSRLDGCKDQTPASLSESAQHRHKLEKRSSKSSKRKQAERGRRSRSRDSKKESARHTKKTAENIKSAKDRSRSEKQRKRRREESEGKEGTADVDTSSKHKKQRAEKKKETEEKSVWENRVKVKPQKKINIKINLKTTEEKLSESADRAIAETSQVSMEATQEVKTKEEESVETSEEWQVTDVYWEYSKDVENEEDKVEEGKIIHDGEDEQERADDGEKMKEESVVSDPKETSEGERGDVAVLPEETQPAEEATDAPEIDTVVTSQEAPEDPVAHLNSESNVSDNCRIEEETSETEKTWEESRPDLRTEGVDIQASPSQQEEIPSHEDEDKVQIMFPVQTWEETTENEANKCKEDEMFPKESVESEENSCMAPSSVQVDIATSSCEKKSKDEDYGKEETTEMDTQNYTDDSESRNPKEEKESEGSSSASGLERLFQSATIPMLSHHVEIKEVEESSNVFSSETQTKLSDENVSILTGTKSLDKQIVNCDQQDDQTVNEADEDVASQNFNKTEPLTFTPYVEPQEPKVIIPESLDEDEEKGNCDQLDDRTVNDADEDVTTQNFNKTEPLTFTPLVEPQEPKVIIPESLDEDEKIDCDQLDDQTVNDADEDVMTQNFNKTEPLTFTPLVDPQEPKVSILESLDEDKQKINCDQQYDRSVSEADDDVMPQNFNKIEPLTFTPVVEAQEPKVAIPESRDKDKQKVNCDQPDDRTVQAGEDIASQTFNKIEHLTFTPVVEPQEPKVAIPESLDEDKQKVNCDQQHYQTVSEADDDVTTQNKIEPLTFTPYVEPQEPKVVIPGLDFDDVPVVAAPLPDLTRSTSSHKEPLKSRCESSVKDKEKTANGRKRESRQEQWKKYKLEKEQQEAERRQEILRQMAGIELKRNPHFAQEVTPSVASSSNRTNLLINETDAAEDDEELKMSEERGQEVDDRWIRSM